MWKNDLEWLSEVNKLKQQRDDAIKIATIFQGAYLRIGGADDPYYSSLIMQECFKCLAELKGMRYYGLNDCCEDPHGFVGGTCDNCGGKVIPEKDA